MKIITNFQMDPIDIFKRNKQTTEEMFAQEVAVSRPIAEAAIRGEKTDFEDLLVIYHPYEHMVLDYTQGVAQYKKINGVKYFNLQSAGVDSTSKKMVYFGPGHLYICIRERVKPTQPYFLGSIMQALVNQGVKFQYKNNDFEMMNGEKFLGGQRLEGNGIRMEVISPLFDIDLKMCEDAITPYYFNREYAKNGGGGRVTCIKEHYPDFDMNQCLKEAIDGYNRICLHKYV